MLAQAVALPEGVTFRPWVLRLGLFGEVVLAVLFLKLDCPVGWFVRFEEVR